MIIKLKFVGDSALEVENDEWLCLLVLIISVKIIVYKVTFMLLLGKSMFITYKKREGKFIKLIKLIANIITIVNTCKKIMNLL